MLDSNDMISVKYFSDHLPIPNYRKRGRHPSLAKILIQHKHMLRWNGPELNSLLQEHHFWLRRKICTSDEQWILVQSSCGRH